MNGLLRFMKYDRKMENLIVFALIGVILIIAGSFFTRGESGGKNATKTDLNKTASLNSGYEDELEKKLEDMLSNVKGVKEVKVMVMLASDKGTMVPAVDNSESKRITEEKDSQGGSRTITEYSSDKKTVTVNTSSGNQPVVLSETAPEVKGVLVVVNGPDDSDFLYKLSSMVQVALGIPAYKVMVVAGK
ncbi:hypothetical protein [Caldanaerobius polysaccharolyticus]|uniref:hypothetical protein n=1 Tax=Caldanaerobius polysaccharolyticus TaxID=44256 RepID=UPI00047B7600|nr:hypothetical protein [Caldanaerobius polysaccharolyticus]